MIFKKRTEGGLGCIVLSKYIAKPMPKKIIYIFHLHSLFQSRYFHVLLCYVLAHSVYIGINASDHTSCQLGIGLDKAPRLIFNQTANTGTAMLSRLDLQNQNTGANVGCEKESSEE